MSRVRFATAQALFDAFPEVSQKVSVKPTDQPPVDFARALSSHDKLPEAVAFCAYLLPRREAVWWACASVRALASGIAREPAVGLLAAEAWAYQPDDQNRQKAFEIGSDGDQNDPSTWLARAAGWAGGFQVLGDQQVPTPQYMTARAVRIAILLSAARIGSSERLARLRSCITDGIKLAETGIVQDG
ncbi:hypothetical protein [Bradyrhizobium sp. CCBAU 51753]|uniref:DUF6931 family protein n=1 Tax=Bradyrhizobium sp. CCBAU 51753 TaxID=1325100 RepID=UPI00188AAFA7|nr:hypothetical protein [Bradyrhizobium sp. CCBAU 51753]